VELKAGTYNVSWKPKSLLSYYPMNAYGNLHNSLSTDFETETLNHYIVALPTDYTRYCTNNYYIPI